MTPTREELEAMCRNAQCAAIQYPEDEKQYDRVLIKSAIAWHAEKLRKQEPVGYLGEHDGMFSMPGFYANEKELSERGSIIPLYLHPQPAPEGWQLVPKEPTPEMLGAGLRHVNGMASMPASYRAMLAAAPAYKEE